ncbi:MAG TPA: 23S rRNA (guanosine(2251)-2'-O)-methyltransferase RlmB [Patescibacteria group bacterium]|nr:23S rRNA (guanosine(2251)-2'-O)-methyltransferase RlmB [Patescibacteria group bacterium]
MRLYGKRSVSERLKADPASIKRLYIEEGLQRPEIVSLGRKAGIAVECLRSGRFAQLAQGNQTQGVIAEVTKFVYRDFDELISQDPASVLIFLDRINDPHNLGVILRSCACFGNFSVVLPGHESAQVNETVLKVACGAENYVPVSLITNLSVAIQKAQKQGYWIASTVVEGGDNPRQARLNFPLGLVFGSEGQGVRPGLLKHIDYRLTLPMTGAGLSFNVAIAVSIFCYEISSQRQADEKK